MRSAVAVPSAQSVLDRHQRQMLLLIHFRITAAGTRTAPSSARQMVFLDSIVAHLG